MAKAKNAVIAGDYLGNRLNCTLGIVMMMESFKPSVPLNKDIVETYELITDEHRKSASSGVARGRLKRSSNMENKPVLPSVRKAAGMSDGNTAMASIT